ncbi:MAG: bifunctional demethylmenaquinone methyltransferase/2-methoxy-6-polyprenyl-1,4-benzoquinol methylase UbiE [Bacteriovoracaceae bacterium]|nr:bifunctional demethylmenaquinone methyltransferase/2-methoxy-6-polyprenyl-1,4-benzoquinol methylase UbiE [Bacteriovoracaceae bacterium]
MASGLQARKKESWKIFDDIAKTYDPLNRLLSMGIDVYWRHKLLKHLPNKKNMITLDLATGTGDVPVVLVKSPDITKVIGMDLSKGMVEIGQQKMKKHGLDHIVDLRIGDGTDISLPDSSVDMVTISFGIRNFSDPKKSLKEILRVLRPGGRVQIMEFSIPKNWFFRKVYFFYFRNLLPFIGNIISGHKDAYTYLNETVEDFAYGEEFKGWLEEAGFKNSTYDVLTFGIATLYRGDKA